MESNEIKFSSTVFFIEASSFEQFCLWKENHQKIPWKEDCAGNWQIIGYIDKKKKKPVCVSFSFAELFEQRVCFYCATSRYVDHSMVRDWIIKNYPIKYDTTRTAMTDAMNFHHAIHHCQNLYEAK